MNLIVDAPVWLLILLAIVLAAAAIEDAARLRISNVTSLLVIAGAIAAVAVEGFRITLWQNAAVFLIVLALGTAAFAAKFLGGGDVKLLTGLGLWVDFRGAVALIAAVFLAGGVLALLYLLSRAVVRSESIKTRQIPYGIAIAAGAVFVFAMQRADLPGQRHPRPLPSLKALHLPNNHSRGIAQLIG